jgi:hypothetical protein
VAVRRTLAFAAVLAVLAGAVVASVATAVPADRSSTLRPWGNGPAATHTTAEIATPEGVGLTFAVTGGTGQLTKARGQMHETFLPTGEFRFAFTLYL